MTVLTVPEACAFLRMGKSTLYTLLKNQAIPYIRRPRSRAILFVREDLEAWLLTGRRDVKLPPEASSTDSGATARAAEVVDISAGPVYHRNPRYRQAAQ